MSDVHETITRICEQVLERSGIEHSSNLILLGADSMVAVEIVTQIEVEYGVDVVETFFASPTIDALASAVELALTEAERTDDGR